MAMVVGSACCAAGSAAVASNEKFTGHQSHAKEGLLLCIRHLLVVIAYET